MSTILDTGFSKEASRCRIEALLDVRFYHPGVSPELELDSPCVYRIQGAYLWAIAITTAQEILRIDGFEEARYGQLQELVFYGGNPQGTQRAIPLRNILASDAFGAVPLLLQALHEVVDVFVPVLLVFLGTHLIHSSGGILSDVAPALLQEVLIAHPGEVAEPISLLTCCLLGYALQGGWHCGSDPACSGNVFLCRLRIPVRPFPVGTALPSQSTMSGSDPLVVLGSPFGKAYLWLTPQEP